MGAPPPLLQLVVILILLVLMIPSSTASITFPLPSYCTKICGSFTFQYPFGVGRGCFRPGFELTCDTTANPPKLLLGNGSSTIEVVDDVRITQTPFSVRAPVAASMSSNESFSYISWAALANSPFYLRRSTNYFSLQGCDAVGSLLDLTSNQTLATCNTTCLVGLDPSLPSCDVRIESDVQSYGIQLSRTNGTSAVKASYVTASIKYGMADLSWGIHDQPSCEEARKEMNNYACLSNSSKCSDLNTSVSAGYWCECPGSVGNPFLPRGCRDDLLVNVLSSTKCTRRCGNVTIPFPFGLEMEKGCYRDETFAVTCNETSSPPVLNFGSGGLSGEVNNIMVDEGKIEVTSLDTSIIGFFGTSYQSGSFALNQGRVIYQWAIYEEESCAVAQVNVHRFACRSNNSKCVDADITSDLDQNVVINNRGYSCKCFDGFEGNPYVRDGCKDIDECKNPSACYGKCINTLGSYKCISNKLSGLLLGVIFGVSIGFGTIILAITSIVASRKWNKIRQKRTRQRHFRENHGLLLEQLIASNEDIAEKIKIFPLEELERATNNFDSSKVLGQGGHGIVYKGILSDQRVVAIKRSKIREKCEIIEFLNEVTILSQINHRNVVKLFGCCLESEVPLLVYECISNGTLSHHLHSSNKKSTLTWRDRLRIATEAAGALAYLHSSASISIFHRDMKSSNILLDDYYTAKVSDFGASRLIPLEQTHIFTAIQGTLGYLDPEYYQTCQLTGKSDVYSFGVILLELLTGEEPISVARNEEEINLVVRFLRALSENRHFELVEAQIMEEGKIEEIDEVARLAEMCLKLKGIERPTMTEVEVRLRGLQKAKFQQRVKDTTKGNEEIVPLLKDIFSSPFLISPIVQSSSQSTRNYSLEREMISSIKYPR